MFERCEQKFANKDWSLLAVDCSEAFTRKMRMLLLERGVNVNDMNAKELMDLAVISQLKLNPKIHQIRMIRNDFVHNGYKLDKLDEGIVKVTYQYLKPFFRKQNFNKAIFKQAGVK